MRWKRRLTDEEMQQIWVASQSGNPELAIKMVYEIALADEGKTWDEEEEIRPTQFAIPRDQWVQIGEWLTQGSPRGSVGPLLSMMNVGPSSYDDKV